MHDARFARTPTERLLGAVVRGCSQVPWAVLTAALLLSVAGLWLTITRLQFHGSRDDIATANAIPHTARYLEYGREFPDDASIVVVVDGRDPARAEAFADRLAERLARLPMLREVFHRVDPSALGGRALLYLPGDALRRLGDALAEGRAVLSRVARRPGLVTFVEAVNDDVTRRLGAFAADDLLGPAPGSPGAGPLAVDAGGLANAARALARTVEGEAPPSPGMLAETSGVVAEPGGARYLWSDNGRFLFVLATPAESDAARRRFFDQEAAEAEIERDPTAAVRAAVTETRRDFPSLDAGVTGPEALSADEETSTRRDVALAVLLGFAGNVLVLAVFFRSPLRTGGVLLCTGIALAWSFGVVTATIGHLNILSAVFASILLGVGIDFPIHLLARYEEAEQEGRPLSEALELMVVRTGGVVGLSALVLVAAALANVAADLPAIAELGIISAAGLLLSLVAAYTVFPALLVILARHTARRGSGVQPSGARSAPARPGSPGAAGARLALALGRSRWALRGGVIGAALSGLLVVWRPPAYDSNLLDLQDEVSESVRYEQRLIDEGGAGTWFVVTDAADLAEARRKAKALAARPLVDRVESVLDLVPEDDEQEARRRIIREIRPLVERLDVQREAAPPFALEPFRSAVSRLAFKLGSAPGDDTAAARLALLDLLAAIDRAGPPEAERRLAAAQASLVDDLSRGVRFLRANLETTPITLATLPPSLRSRFVGRTGRLLLRIYPTENTWEREAMARFLADVRTVDPGVTGPRVQGYEVTEAMRRDYARASVVAVAVIAAVALAAFRNVADVLAGMIPLVVGGLWTAGAMVLLGLDFDLANLFAVPLVIGLAVDTGMNLVGRAREEPHRAASILDRSVGKSVLLAALTTLAGFGPLLLAHHHGVVSLGLLLCLGTVLTTLAAFVVLPPALARRRPARAGGAAAVALLFAGALPAWSAPAPVGPAFAVRDTIESARTIMRDPSLDGAARKAQVRRLIAERFDTEAMARAALGREADRLSPAQWREYRTLFTTLFTRSYSRMVLSFLEGVEVRYGEAEAADGGETVVRTTLRRSQGETLPVDYRVRPRDGGFTFTDVVIDGLSLVASYRSQLQRVVQSQGPEALLQRMRSRQERER